jgi:uncharacterized phage-associated protein
MLNARVVPIRASLTLMALRFDEAKATQAAAFILKLRGGQMHYLKLIKLLYLSDREALIRWGIPITTDRYVSMNHGPVLSNIFNLITEEGPKPTWGRFISAPMGDYEVRLLQEAPTDRLSRAEETLLREIYGQFGHRNRWDIVDNVMHKLPEWTYPDGSSVSISVREILSGAGEDEEEIKAVVKELRAMSNL